MALGKLAIGALNFVTRIVLARLLGPAGLGVYGILTYAVTLCVAITNAGTQNSHIHDLGKKISTPGGDLGFSVLFAAGAGGLGIVAFYAAYDLLLYDWYFAKYFEVKYPKVILIFLAVPANILWLHLSSILLGVKQFRAANAFIILQSLLLVVFLLVFSQSTLGPLESAVAAWVMSTVVAVCLLLGYGLVEFRATLALKVTNLPRKLKFGSLAMISGLSETLTLLAPVFIAGYFLDSREVGILFLALSLARIVEQMAVVLNSVLFPYNASLDLPDAVRLTSNSFRIFLYLSIAGLILSVPVAVYAVPLLFGAEYDESSILLIAMMPGIVSLSLIRILHAFFLAQSRPQTPIVAYVATLFAIITFEILLIPVLGSLGAALGITAAYLVGLVIIVVRYLAFTGTRLANLCRISRADLALIRNG